MSALKGIAVVTYFQRNESDDPKSESSLNTNSIRELIELHIPTQHPVQESELFVPAPMNVVVTGTGGLGFWK